MAKKILGKKQKPKKVLSKKTVAKKKPAPKKKPAAKKTPAKKPEEKPIDPSKPLEDKFDEMFCHEVLKQPNPSKAFRVLNDKVTKQSSWVLSSRMLSKVNVSRRIAFLMQAAADDTIMTKKEAMRILTERGRADLSDYVTCGADGVTFTEFGPELPNPRAVQEISTKTVKNEHGDEVHEAVFTKIKLHDGEKSIKTLGKMLGWEEPEEHKHTVETGPDLAALIADANGATRGLPPQALGKEDPNL